VYLLFTHYDFLVASVADLFRAPPRGSLDSASSIRSGSAASVTDGILEIFLELTAIIAKGFVVAVGRNGRIISRKNAQMETLLQWFWLLQKWKS